MNRPFSVFSYWDQGNPKIIITMNVGIDIPENGPSVCIRNGKLRITAIEGQTFDLVFPELNKGDEIPIEFEKLNPITGESTIEQSIWRAK